MPLRRGIDLVPHPKTNDLKGIGDWLGYARCGNSTCWLRLGRTLVKVLLFFGGLAIVLVSSRQMFLMFRDGSFRARGDRQIVRKTHPTIFWMNFVGLVLVGVVGVALICWQLLT
jgi:hypothetical protein